MTPEERAEVTDIFISICEKFLNTNKHFHLEPLLARDIMQAIKELEKEIEELKEQDEELQLNLRSRNDLVEELTMQIEKMKSNTEDLIKAQSLCIEDDYNAGLLNGLITTYNSIFEERFLCCKWNEHKNKWGLAE